MQLRNGEFRSYSCLRTEGIISSCIDDIADRIFYNDSWEEHIKTLKELFGRLKRARPENCLPGSNKMDFLGHQIGCDVITSSLDNKEKVRKTTQPTTKKQVRSFLGLVGYNRDHILAFCLMAASLSYLLKTGKSEQKQWNEAQVGAYSLLKEYLVKKPVLNLAKLTKPLVLETDASGVGVAAVQLQVKER